MGHLARRIDKLEEKRGDPDWKCRRVIVEEGEILEQALDRQGLPREFDGLTIARLLVSPATVRWRREAE